MPSRLIFRCQFCDAVPDDETHASLSAQLRAQLFGEYLDAMPGGWLTFTGNGICGPARYACFEHRDDLTTYVRKHYGTVAWQTKKTGPTRATRRRAPSGRRQAAVVRRRLGF